jgi:hypothetical protein
MLSIIVCLSHTQRILWTFSCFGINRPPSSKLFFLQTIVGTIKYVIKTDDKILRHKKVKQTLERNLIWLPKRQLYCYGASMELDFASSQLSRPIRKPISFLSKRSDLLSTTCRRFVVVVVVVVVVGEAFETGNMWSEKSPSYRDWRRYGG